MPGLDTMMKQILAEAEQTAAAAIAEAKAEAGRILAEADADCQAEQESFAKKEEAGRTAAAQRAQSAADLKKRQLLLSARQQMITEVIEKAHTAILALPAEEYFALIRSQLKKNLMAKDGYLCMNRRDLARIPAGFAAEADAMAAAAGGSLKIKETPVDIDGGFVLIYGGMEENCSFDALFRSERERLTDLVYQTIFMA